MGELGFINGIDFGELDAMKYYAPPSSWSKEKKQQNARSKIFSGDWVGAEKKDGYFCKIVKDDDHNILVYSRSRGVNGEYANKREWLPQLDDFFAILPRGTCLLGELYLPSSPGSKNVTTILGCLKSKAIERQAQSEPLHFYAFDCLAWHGMSHVDDEAQNRFKLLQNIDRLSLNSSENFVSYARYFCGQKLWEKLQEILNSGGEGIVLVDRYSPYEPGKRPSKTTLKIKKELQNTIDCFFTGRTSEPTRLYTGKEVTEWQYWENTRTGEKMMGGFYDDYFDGAPIEPVTKSYFNGWAGSLEIAVLKYHEGSRCVVHGYEYKDMEVFPIGYLSGLTEEIKANPRDYAFRPLEVMAMEWSASSNALRHGKMLGWRDDLAIGDCTYDKIMG